MSSNEKLNIKDDVWQQLFEKHKIMKEIEQNGQFQISSTEINKYKEARLMTKFDNSSQLPKIFIENKLSILPITRGSYIIAPFQNYKNFDTNSESKTEKVKMPDWIESITTNITSEAIALNSAYISNIIVNFCGEEVFPTVSGRMGSGKFEFDVTNIYTKKDIKINVENSQLEIDGGYEGRNALYLIEAKNYIAEDFLIRQLYYPYRLWNSMINKEIKNIFMTYSNGIYRLFEFRFDNMQKYSSIVQVRQKKYSLVEDITMNEIMEIAKNIKIEIEPDVPFPQADSFERVINLCELLEEKLSLTAEEITTNYDFDKRQTSYYTRAGMYLGLIETDRKNNYYLSNKGKQIFKINLKQRQLKLIEAILVHEAFYKTFKTYILKTARPSRKEIVNIMQKSNLKNIESYNTYERRASTIIGWIEWILCLYERE